MPGTPSQQRNIYRGEPARAWVRVQLIGTNGRSREVDLLVDTGNPCAIIIDKATMHSLRWRASLSADSNFGPLEGSWLRIAILEFAFDVKTLGYPDSYGKPTAQETWQSRYPIDRAERERLHLTIERIQTQMENSIDPASRESFTAADEASVHRRVVRQARGELGVLSTTWRLITLPIQPTTLAKIS
ncbi:MAG: hypothetical protein GXY83_27550 [Rhodopirellula sp.]|nr:hypothetical protein [Rhodopirellula sp.]